MGCFVEKIAKVEEKYVASLESYHSLPYFLTSNTTRNPR